MLHSHLLVAVAVVVAERKKVVEGAAVEGMVERYNNQAEAEAEAEAEEGIR